MRTIIITENCLPEASIDLLGSRALHNDVYGETSESTNHYDAFWVERTWRRSRMTGITAGSWLTLLPGPLGPLGVGAIFLRDRLGVDKIEAITLGKELSKASRGKAIGGLAIVTILVAAVLAIFFSEVPGPAFWVILALLVAIWAGYLWGARRPKSLARSQDPDEAFP